MGWEVEGFDGNFDSVGAIGNPNAVGRVMVFCEICFEGFDLWATDKCGVFEGVGDGGVDVHLWSL